jgi:hypothetical protein
LRRSGLVVFGAPLQASLLLNLPLAAPHFQRIATVVLAHGRQDAFVTSRTSSPADPAPRNLGRPVRPRLRLTRPLGCCSLSPTNLEAIATVDGLDVENLATCDSQNAFDGRRNVLVHPVRELDYDDRAFARRAHQPATD